MEPKKNEVTLIVKVEIKPGFSFWDALKMRIMPGRMTEEIRRRLFAEVDRQ